MKLSINAILMSFIIILSSLAVFSFSDKDLGYVNNVRGDIEEIENAFLEKESIDVLVWLKDNEYTSPEYQADLDKKRIEIRKIQDKVLSELNEDEFELIARFEVTNGIAGTITKEGFEELKENKYVESIYMDRIVYAALAESRPLIKADMVERRYHVTGEGVTVCVLDTGVDYTHPALGGCFGENCRVVGGHDFMNIDEDPMDDNGHGTHVSGIVASSNITYRGVAPDAKLAAVKVLGSDGRGHIIRVGLGVDWCVANKDRFNIKIITMSLGIVGGVYDDSSCPTNINPSINNAINSRIFVDASSGNDASINGVGYPACAPGVTSVGAVYDANVGYGSWSSCADATTEADKIVCFTNRASNLDLLAPGAIIRSTASNSGTTCTIGRGGFYPCSGTSMAAPHVAGVAALLFEKDPSLTPSEIESIMEDTGKMIFDSGTSLEFPRVNAFAAVSRLFLRSVNFSEAIEPDNISRFP